MPAPSPRALWCPTSGGAARSRAIAARERPRLVRWLHAAGVANGGTAIEDPPGVREGGFGNLYLAYLRDPDGNKLCALHRMG